MTALLTCPACARNSLTEIYRHDAIPVQSCILLDTAQEARDFPLAPLVLTFCDDCGFVFNSQFDPTLVDYASATEESQHFSGTFNAFARQLVAEVAQRYDLSGKTTLEIGCGKGDFLKELVSATGTNGIGVDPGFIVQRLIVDDAASLHFRREFFDPDKIAQKADFVVCRHTLEHIPDVGQFVSDIFRVTAAGPEARILFETPDVARVLDEGAFWDVYYEHCSYFSLGSHARLFRRHNMPVSQIYLAYDGQYIIQYASSGAEAPTAAAEDDLERMRALASAFPQRVAERRRYWTEFVRDRHAAGKRIAIWGGGSKGVSFLTTNPISNEVAQVIDINPYKQGKFLPGTGLEVIGPDALVSAPPDTVIVMNPIYLDEIGAQLASMNIRCELVAV